MNTAALLIGLYLFAGGCTAILVYSEDATFGDVIFCLFFGPPFVILGVLDEFIDYFRNKKKKRNKTLNLHKLIKKKFVIVGENTDDINMYLYILTIFGVPWEHIAVTTYTTEPEEIMKGIDECDILIIVDEFMKMKEDDTHHWSFHDQFFGTYGLRKHKAVLGVWSIDGATVTPGRIREIREMLNDPVNNNKSHF